MLTKEKEYIAAIKTGIKTDTWDITGKTIRTDNVKIRKKDLAMILKDIKGKYHQKIPAYSARKKSGRHLYEYARQGIEVESGDNDVTIYDIKLLNFSLNEFHICICCSAGTYIRSIANDIGEKLSCGAVLSELKRTKIGKFSLNDAVTVSELINDFGNAGHDAGIKGSFNYKYFILLKMLADRKKTIYVYKKYFKMLEKGYPLYGYMINNKRTDKKLIKENDIFFIKNSGCKRSFLHKSVVDFSTNDILNKEQKLTKSISIEDT